MQHSPCEIKEKLLRALDKEYNVVDMATVLEVISILEQTLITRETLERTRIGKYINELRKKTSNDQLARRAKELVKSWRKLLPQIGNSINGERLIRESNIPVSLGSGPINKFPKATSPSVSCERSASPFCSSASNSPQQVLNRLSNRPLTPSSYCSTGMHSAVASVLSANVSSQMFKPVSPALSGARFANLGPSITHSDSIPHPRPQNICISPAHCNNSQSCSPSSDCSAMNAPSDATHGQLNENATSMRLQVSSGNAHSTLDIAKTNVANKRLRKSIADSTRAKKKKSMNDYLCDSSLQNGVEFSASERLVPSESSAFKSLKPKILKSRMRDTIKETNTKFEKAKRAPLESQVSSDLLKETFSSLGAGSKLPKVKTTQQLIEELQARKDALNQPFSKLRDHEPEGECNSCQKSPNDAVPNSELSGAKSEVVKMFLSSSPESPLGSCHGSPTDDGISSHSDIVPSNSSVITSDKDNCSIPARDPISIEIEQIRSRLPPLNVEELHWDADEPLPERKTCISIADLNSLSSEHWDGVNGNYSADGSWRSWQECSETVIAPNEVLRVLPYVNID